MRKTIPCAGFLLLLASTASAQIAPPVPGAQPEVVTLRGVKFYSLPDAKGTVAAAQKALDADPKNVDLLQKLEQAQAGVWQYREAVATCTRALALALNNADLYIERGHRDLALRRFTQARADLDRAVQLDATKLDAYYHLGLAHYFLGEFSEAADAFRHAVDKAPTVESRINSTNWLYASLRRAGKTDEAAQALAKVTPNVTTADSHSQFYLNLLRFFQRSKNENEVVPPEPPRDNAVDPEPELRFDTVAYGVGNWFLYNGNKAKALEYFDKIAKGHVWVTWGFVGADVDSATRR